MSGRGPDGAGSATWGRETELSTLLGLLDVAGAGDPAATVLSGEPGSGKTHLLRAVAGEARSRGWAVLPAVGVEAESVLPGAALLSVLGPVRGHLGALSPAQGAALTDALGWGPPTDSRADRFLVGAATLALLSAAAAQSPVLVTVDDVQWVDDESADALAFAARRLGHDRVALVFTHRSGTPRPSRLSGIAVLELRGLPAPAAGGLLGPGFSAEVTAHLVSETGGNPLALVECRRVLDPAQRAGAAPLPSTLPVPDTLRSVFVDELAGLSAPSWRAATLCAAVAEPDPAPVLAALDAEGLDVEECLSGATGVLVLEDESLTFRHPLLRAAAWHRASRSERLSAHARLAQVLPPGTARTWQRAQAATGPDADLAAELAAVAEADRTRHGFAAASRAMERAARLAPERVRRQEWLAVATGDALIGGDTGRARRLAAEVLASDAGPGPRATVLYALGLIEQAHGTLVGSRDLLERAAQVATGRRLLRTLAELLGAYHLLDDTAGMLSAADRAAAAADPDDPEQAMLAAYVEGAARVVEGRFDLGFPLLHKSIELLETDPALRDDPRHLVVSSLIPRYLMDPWSALPYAERRIARAREAGALGALAMALSVYAMGLAWMGDHVRAHAWAGEAVELLEALDLRVDVGTASEAAALEDAYRGRHDAATRHLDRARAVVAANGFDPMPPHLGRVVATCALCAGDLETVVEVLEDQIARFGGVGAFLEPLGVAPDLVEAYLVLGRDDEARELSARFRAAQPDPMLPQVAAMVARCEGLVAPDLSSAEASFERAIALHDPRTDRFESARTRLLRGMRLRRAGRRVDARTHLDAARLEFSAMDLTLWSERARAELAATGEHAQTRAGTGESLTSQETRVALLVAQGLTNREVAAALFLSPKTVEHHLGAVLRKRGLRSRTELARSLALGHGDQAGPGPS
ncbi:helix-turn-helix transcriptional regulator [Pedococcus bigeumensis]|uniref:helix-turn-helix transcriptional regulator n=1 Tax=Pedococcus bigeumensis TaxID=433644 RepID=UPI002FE94C0A